MVNDFETVYKLKQEAFAEKARSLGMTVDELYSIKESFEYHLWIKDVNPDGSFYIFPYGMDTHDSISVIGGMAHYRNLQNGDGCILKVIPEMNNEEGYHLLDWDCLTDAEILYIADRYMDEL